MATLLLILVILPWIVVLYGYILFMVFTYKIVSVAIDSRQWISLAWIGIAQERTNSNATRCLLYFNPILSRSFLVLS